MPIIYRIRCSNCKGPQPQLSGGVAGWVTIDGREDGIILPEAYLALKRDDGQFVCLPHPAESITLEKEGFTWREATAQRRLFQVTFKICQDCGFINEEKQHHAILKGCACSILAVVIAIPALKFWLGNDWVGSLIGSATIGCAIYPAAAFASLLTPANRRLRVKACAECGSRRLTTFGGAKRKSLRCPACKEMTLSITSAGMS